MVLVGIVTVFDGVLTAVTKDDSTSIKNRLDGIKNRMESLNDEEWEVLNESDISAFGMYITWAKSMESFQQFSDFKKPEKEPKDLNRNWISHGRKTTNATKFR